MEANRFGDLPSTNPAVQTAFGRNTANVPQTLTFAPMAGFTRQYSAGNGGSFTGGIQTVMGPLVGAAFFHSIKDFFMPLTDFWRFFLGLGRMPSAALTRFFLDFLLSDLRRAAPPRSRVVA